MDTLAVMASSAIEDVELSLNKQKSATRTRSRKVVSSKAFEIVMSFVILVDMLVLATTNPLCEGRASDGRWGRRAITT